MSFRFSLLIISTVLVAPLSSWGQVEIEIIRGVDRMNRAINARETSRQQDPERIEEQRKQEQEILRSREELKNNPGSFPRQRYSHEAALNNNPWAKAARVDEHGVKEIRVELFVTENCADCKQLEGYLNEVGVPYRLYLLQPGTEADQKYQAQVGRGEIPATKINDRIVRGFNPKAIRQAILEERGDIPPPQDDKNRN